MRSSKFNLLFPIVVSLLALHPRPASPQNHVNATEASALASCVQSCSSSILPTYSCDPSASCFCTDEKLTAALEACIKADCTIEEGIAAKKFQADTCNFPVRSLVHMGTATLWSLFSFAILFSLFRVGSRCRAFGGAGYWWDDWTLFLALLPMIGITATGYLGYENGIGKDYWEVGIDGIQQGMKLFYAGEPLYLAVVYGTKVSMVLLYLRIFLTDSRVLRFTCWGVIGTLLMTLVAFEFATIFQCSPISYNWTSFTGGSGRCTDREAQVYTAAAFNIFFDVVVILLPVYHIVKLRISWLKKIGVMCVLLVGVVVIACSVVRLQYLVRYGAEDNVTWNYAYIGEWSIIEVYLSVICVCMPATAGLIYRGWKYTHGQEISNKRSSFGNQSEKLFSERPTGGRLLTTTAQVRGLGVAGADLESGNSSDEQAESNGFYFDGKWFNERRGDVNANSEPEMRASKEYERLAAATAATAAAATNLAEASEMAYSTAEQKDLPVNLPAVVTHQDIEQLPESESDKVTAEEPVLDPSRPSNNRTSSAKSEDPLRSNGLSQSYEAESGDIEVRHSRSYASQEIGRSPSTAQFGAEALRSQGVSSGTTTPDENKIKAGITRSASSSLFSSRRPSASYVRSRSASRRPGTPGGREQPGGPQPARYAHSYVLYNEPERPKISPLQPTHSLSSGDGGPKKSLTSRSASSSLFSGQRESRPPPTPEQRSLAGSKGSNEVPQLRTESEQQLAVEAAKACLGVPEDDPLRSRSSDSDSTTSESSNPDASPAPLPLPASMRQDDRASLRSVSTSRSHASKASKASYRPRILTDDEVSLRSKTSKESGGDVSRPLPSQDSSSRARPLRRHPDQSMQSLDSMATQGRSARSEDSSRPPVLAGPAGKTSMNAMRTQSRSRPSEDSGSSHPLQSQTRNEPSMEERYRDQAAERATNILEQMTAEQNARVDDPSEHRDSNDSAYSSSNSQDEATNRKQQEQMDAQFPPVTPTTDATYATAEEDHPLSAQNDFMPYEAGQKDKEFTTIKPTAYIVETPRLSYELRRTLTDVAFDKPSAEQISAVTPAQGWRHHLLENNGYFPQQARGPRDGPLNVDNTVFKAQPEPESAAAEAESAWKDFDQGIATNNEPHPDVSMELSLPSPQQRREERLGHRHGCDRDRDDEYRDRHQSSDDWQNPRPREDLPAMERGMSLYRNQDSFRADADADLGHRSRQEYEPLSPAPDNRSQNRSSGGSSEKWGPVRPNMNTFKSESTIRPPSDSNRDSSQLEEEHQRRAAEGRSAVLGKDSRGIGYYAYDPPSAEMVNAVAGPNNEAGIDGNTAPGLGAANVQPTTPPTTAKWDPVASQLPSRQRSSTHDQLPRSLYERRQKAAEFAEYVTSRPSTADTATTSQTAYWNPRQSESDYAYGKQSHTPAYNQTYSPASPRTVAELRAPFEQRSTKHRAHYDDQGQRVSPVVQQAKQTEIVVNHESPTAMTFSKEESEDSTYSSTSISSTDISSGNETSPSPPPHFRNSDGSATTQSSSGRASDAARKKKAAQLAKDLIQRSRDEDGDYSFHSKRRPGTADGDKPMSPGHPRSKFSPTTDEGRFSDRSLSRLGSREGFRNDPVEVRPRPGKTGRELRSSWQG